MAPTQPTRLLSRNLYLYLEPLKFEGFSKLFLYLTRDSTLSKDQWKYHLRPNLHFNKVRLVNYLD